MKCKVREGHRLTWPDGTVWAEAGEVVEMHDDIEPQAASNYMQEIAARGGARRGCCSAEEGDEVKAVELPASIRQELVNRGWVSEEPKAAAPKRTRRKKPVDERDSSE